MGEGDLRCPIVIVDTETEDVVDGVSVGDWLCEGNI